MSNLMNIRGIGKVTADKLINSGYATATDLANATAEEINEKVGIPIATATRILESAVEYLNTANDDPDLFEDQTAEPDLPPTIGEVGVIKIVKSYRLLAKESLSKKAFKKYKRSERHFVNQLEKLSDEITTDPEIVKTCQSVAVEIDTFKMLKNCSSIAKKSLSKKAFKKYKRSKRHFVKQLKSLINDHPH